MSQKRLIVALLIIALVCGCIFTGRPLKRAQAATVTNHWTWSFSADNLTYEVYEYSDCRFTVLENNGGLTRTIIGHPYLTWNGDPKAAVDSSTAAYWAQVQTNYQWGTIGETLSAIIGWGSVITATTFVQVAGAVIGAIAGTAAQAVFDSRISHTLTVPDAVKVCYQMAVCAKAACDLARTPGIVIPTESIPPVSE
ncbi:MAG: hypothetical protein ABFC79_03470 [Candidatus Cryosericum sp.]